MTASRIDTLHAIVAAMTPGPWHVDSGTCSDETGEVWCWSDIVSGATRERVLSGVGDEREDRDRAGIVALRNAAPELLAVVEAARRVLNVRVSGGIGVLGNDLSAALDALDARIAALADGGEQS